MKRRSKPRTLRFLRTTRARGRSGEKIFTQTASGFVQASASPTEFDPPHHPEWLRNLTAHAQGFPGESPYSIHFGQRWISSPRPQPFAGDATSSAATGRLLTERRVSAVVKSVFVAGAAPSSASSEQHPINSTTLSGQRLSLVVPEPPTEVRLPTSQADLGRLEKGGRVRFLNSIYTVAASRRRQVHGHVLHSGQLQRERMWHAKMMATFAR
jgi:hypothetical protein